MVAVELSREFLKVYSVTERTRKIGISDTVVFLGYAGRRQSKWWDTGRNLPIGRVAQIASIAHLDFQNSSIKTTDTVIVAGLSFSGASGSPVMLLQKGFPMAGGGDHELYAPAKLIGIMSGHMVDEDEPDEMFKHTGLSSFTRTTSIAPLLG